MKKDSRGPTAAGTVRLVLYVAGASLYSNAARANLEAILTSAGIVATLEIIDVLATPQAALAQGVFSTPSLIVEQGDRRTVVVGDLQSRAQVLQALGHPG